MDELSDIETVRLYGADILASEGMRLEQTFIQHGTTSVYEHSVNVACQCVRLARRLPGETDLRALVRGALLHDYFLYDWHDHATAREHHATLHPVYALQNAARDFELSALEQNMIAAHMFPLPPTRVPQSREAWILTCADKLVAGRETARGFALKARRYGLLFYERREDS